jgi:putative PEP-CTERM system TPR-repeat lipoprotein
MNKMLVTSAIALALSISACSEQKSAEQLLVSAQQHSQQGKFSNAIIDFKNAVRLAPKNAEARLGLGHAYLNQGNYISAEKELDRAVELGADFAKIAPLLAQVKTRLDKFSEVEKLVKASENLVDSDYLVILTYAGMSALADGKVTQAQDYLSQAAAMNAETDFSKLAGAYLLYSERKFTEGLDAVNTLLTRNDGFAEAKLLQGYLYFSLKDFEQASDGFDSYIMLYPQDYNVQFFQANTLIKAEKFEQANTLTDKLLKIFKKSPLALQYKSQISYQAEKYLEAREFANQAIGYDEGFVIAKMIAGVSSYKLNELEQAYDYLIGLEDMLPATHPINVILLSIKIKLGHTDDLTQSVAKLNALKDSDSDTDLLQITSLELMRIGDYTNAQSLLNKAEQVSPGSASIKVQRGALLLSQRDLSGIKSLEQALTIDPSLHETEFALARQYIQGNELTKAQAIADRWLSSEEHQAGGNVLSGMIASKRNDVVSAEKFFNKALSLDKNNISAHYSLASVYLFKEQTKDAIAGYKKVIELNPNHQNAIKFYGVLQIKNKNTPEAISFLSALHDQNKLNGKVHKNLVIGLAQNLRQSEQISAAIDVLTSIKNEKNLSARYWTILANSYKANKQLENALYTHEQAIEAKPASYILRLGFINTLEQLKKYGKALIVAKQANKDFPDDVNLITTLAHLELANNNVQAAKKQLAILKAKGVSNTLILGTEANIAMRDKNYDQAIHLYLGIYDEESSALNVINLARALQFSQQTDAAEQLLESYLIDSVEDNKVRGLLAELYGQNNIDGNKNAKIIMTYQYMIKVQPDDILALNNLAWQEYLSGDLVNAQKHIEQAIVISPGNLSLQESYGVILAAKKEYAKAIEVLSGVLANGSVDVNAQVSLVEAYIAKDQKELAKKILVGLSDHDSTLNIKIAKLKQLVQ